MSSDVYEFVCEFTMMSNFVRCVLTVAINDDDIKYGANMSIKRVTK